MAASTILLLLNAGVELLGRPITTGMVVSIAALIVILAIVLVAVVRRSR